MRASPPITITPSYRGHPRRVRLVVPPHDRARDEPSPPVLVLFDGQNVLGDHGSFAGGWHAHTAVAKLPKTIRRPVIVAIDSGPGRMAELWPEIDHFLRFVMHDVLPLAEHTLSLRFDPSAHGIGGASMGGLASLAAAARHPRVFRKVIAMSPSVWTVPREISRELHRAIVPRDARLYVDVGLRESERMVRRATETAALLARDLPKECVMWRPDARGKHRELDWRRRLPKALRFAYRR
ncbi:MAG: alpha/beta hydrolase [Deltaproteobacteria bacterium]|nr:alpha/beta hydrolase [Deltaproteobacteria bacterium]